MRDCFELFGTHGVIGKLCIADVFVRPMVPKYFVQMRIIIMLLNVCIFVVISVVP
jgi:hypothetical protein